MNISIVIPVRNERDNIRPLAAELNKCSQHLAGQGTPLKEAIFVNDRSDDGTDKELEACSAEYPWLRTISLSERTGKGAALRAGFRLAVGDIIVMMDGDMQHSPADIPEIIAPLLKDRADIVVAARCDFRSSIWRLFLSRSLAFIFNPMFGLHLVTPSEGFKAFLAKRLANIQVNSDGFEFDLELLAEAIAKGFRIEQVGITVHKRTYGKSKVNTFRTICSFTIKMAGLWITQLRGKHV